MDKKNRKFDDIEIEEYKFHQYKIRISINNIDIKDIVVSNKLPLNISVVTRIIKIVPLCTFCPKMSICRRYFYNTKFMYFFIKDEKAFDKYSEIWEKFSNITKSKYFLKAAKN